VSGTISESDLYFGRYVKRGAFGKFFHERAMTPIDKQAIVRMNRDSDAHDDPPYCSHWYHAGTFVLPDLTVEQMQARVLTKLREVGVPDSRARALARRIPSLRRWKVDP
jgi:Putative zinc ribbon domain